MDQVKLITLITSTLFAFEAIASSCPKDHFWVNPYFRNAYVRFDGTSVSASNVKGHCKKLSETDELWLKKFSDSAPVQWPHKNEKFKKWSMADKEKILEVLSTFPKEFIDSKIVSIHRGLTSKDAPNPATSADGIITVYDSALTKDYNLQRVLAHEFAHQSYLDLTDEDRRDYQFSTNWILLDERSNSYVSRKDGYVQDDGRGSPEEDYANNIEFYLIEPDQLKKITPNAYEWIKRRFGDKFKLSNRKGNK